jgi:hypothetical protein
MAFLDKETFEKALQEQYNSLTKQDFGILLNASKDKIKELISSGDIVIEKNEEIDDFEVTYVSNQFYETAFSCWQFVSKTKRLSFKQYKCLAAFVKFRPKSCETEFKQF